MAKAAGPGCAYTVLAELVTRRTGLDTGNPAIARRLAEAAPNGIAAHLVADLANLPDAAPAWQSLLDQLVIPETYLFRDPAQLALASAVALAPALDAPILGGRCLEAPSLNARFVDTLCVDARFADTLCVDAQVLNARGLDPRSPDRAARALRLWSVGCCSGEEAYTLAILATQALVRAGLASPDGAELRGAWSIEVLGSDICASLLDRANAATYGIGILSPFRATPPDCLAFFPGHTHQTRTVRADIRSRVRFLRAGVMALLRPALQACDVVACRNVLVYLSEPARRHTLALLSAAVRPGGVLLLGPADTPPASGFRTVWSGDAIVYQRKPAP